MRNIFGAVCVVGLLVGCGGTVEDTESPAAPASEPGRVEAEALCTRTKPHYSRYYYENGVNCGLTHFYCEGEQAHSGCETATFNEYYWCGCP